MSDLRSKLLDKGNDYESKVKYIPVGDDENVKVKLVPLTHKESTEVLTKSEQNEDIPRIVAYVIYSTHYPDDHENAGERVFEWPTDIEPLSNQRNHQWMTELFQDILQINGMRTADTELEDDKKN